MAQVTKIGCDTYVTVAASQTAATISSAEGAYLQRLVIIPATVSPGVVTLYDGTGTGQVTIMAFAGGANSVTELKPIVVELGIRSRAVGDTTHGFYVTTGANVSVIAVGLFS